LDANPRLKLSSNLILRRSKRFLQVKRLIAEGRLGELYHLEADYAYGRLAKIVEGWRGALEDFSVIHSGGVHMVDLLMWFLGSEVAEVTAYGNRIATRGTRFRHDDCITAILRFRNGATGKMSANFGCVHPHFHPVSLYGTLATFQNTLEGGRLITDRTPGTAFEPVADPYPGCRKGELLGDFLDSIRDGREAEVSAAEVFRTMSVCFAIVESARQGAPVAVEYL
jgi:predicted dehydrogenase